MTSAKKLTVERKFTFTGALHELLYALYRGLQALEILLLYNNSTSIACKPQCLQHRKQGNRLLEKVLDFHCLRHNYCHLKEYGTQSDKFVYLRHLSMEIEPLRK